MIETLGLSNIYGIGHSAGATDLLLAAKLNPTRFARLFVMEPTVMDPHATRPERQRLERRCEPPPCKACCAARPNSTARKLRSFVIRPRRLSRSGRSRRSGPTSVMASRRSRMAGCGCAAHPRLSQPSCSRSTRRWSRFTTAMRAAIHSRGCPRSAVRCASPPLETPGPSIKRWRHAPSRCFQRRANGSFEGVGHCVAQEAPALLLQALEAFAADAG